MTKRRLGKNQQAILKTLEQNRFWSPSCGWYWGTNRETVRLLDTLVARGLARKDEKGAYRPTGN